MCYLVVVIQEQMDVPLRKYRKTSVGGNMEQKENVYLKLFTSTFYLSAFTFGGGYVIVPLMKKKFVSEFHWIEEEEMIDLVAIAQSAPGVIAVNASIIIGYRIAGIKGALITVLGTILPPLILITIISHFYEAFKANIYINMMLKAMQAAVGAVIIDVVYGMVKTVVKDGQALFIALMIAAFVASFMFKLNVMILILLCGCCGYAFSVYYRKKG